MSLCRLSFILITKTNEMVCTVRTRTYAVMIVWSIGSNLLALPSLILARVVRCVLITTMDAKPFLACSLACSLADVITCLLAGVLTNLLLEGAEDWKDGVGRWKREKKRGKERQCVVSVPSS